MGRVSREARLLFVLLWTVVDDAGRIEAHITDLAVMLYPKDFDAERYLLGWLDELEDEGCIERYVVDDVDYLRVVRWRKHQRICHATPSALPPSPTEPAEDSRIREPSRNPRGRKHKGEDDQALAARSDMIREIDDDETPVVVNQESLLRDLRRIQRLSEVDGAHTAALRAVEMKGRSIGFWDKGAKSRGHSGPSLAEAHGRTPSPAEIFGLPETR